MNILILESWGAVKKVWVDNSRKDYYEADPNTLDIIKQRVIEGLHRRLNETKSSIDMVNNSLEGKNRYSAQREQFYKKRLQKTRKMYEQVNDLLELFSKD
jgi:DNA-binding transcriptional regulator GbsR (MarR family)